MAPRFSIITPVYDPPADVLVAMLRSVRAQTFTDWELCLVDDSSPSPHVREILDRAAADDARIRVLHRDTNGGISAASNDALAMAEGEFVALVDNDDELHVDALSLVNDAIVDHPDVDYLYTDEDKIDRAGNHSGPFFKPGWSPERLRTQMYTCHLSVLRRSVVDDVGGFDPAFDGSQDWDLVLRVTERARRVVHIPRVLYHWRTLDTSAAGAGEEAKPWAFEAGTRALQAHCDRTGIPAEVVRDLDLPGVYHLEQRITAEPSVSIVIPSAAQTRDVWFKNEVLVLHCVESIVERSTYRNFEIVVVVDDEFPDDVARRLTEIAGDRLRVVVDDREFNFSRRINLGVIHGEGEFVLLLNDDIEVATADWIERLVMYATIDGVGVVGAKLILQDRRVQHAGVEFSTGLPGHPGHGYPPDHAGYANQVHVARNLLALTGACLMVRRQVFDAVGGLNVELPSNYNDIDFCLKVHHAGHRVVYDPDCVLYHFESSSRSSDVDDWEKEYFLDRWGTTTMNDPYSNPNMNEGEPRLVSYLAWARHSRRGLKNLIGARIDGLRSDRRVRSGR